MTHPLRILRLSGAALGALVLALTATSAHASAPSTVSVRGSTSGAVHSYRATSNGSVAMSWQANPSGTAPMSCSSIIESGTITDGPTGWYPPTTFATVDANGAWTGCTSVGINVSVTTAAWDVGIIGDTVAGVTPEIIPDIHAEVTDVDFGGLLCDFDMDGSVTGSFDNATQDLTIDNSALTVTVDPHGTGADCAGLFKDGGSADFSGAFHLTDTSGTDFPITISS